MGIVEIGILVSLGVTTIATVVKLLKPEKAKKVDEAKQAALDVWETIEALSKQFGWLATEKRREFHKRVWPELVARGFGGPNARRLDLVDQWAEEWSAKEKVARLPGGIAATTKKSPGV